MPLARFGLENVSTAELAKAFTDTRRVSTNSSTLTSRASGACPATSLPVEAPTGRTWTTQTGLRRSSPFGLFPVLHIRTADGTELRFPESLAVEYHLAKKFGLLGDNEWEEQLIK